MSALHESDNRSGTATHPCIEADLKSSLWYTGGAVWVLNKYKAPSKMHGPAPDFIQGPDIHLVKVFRAVGR